MSALTLIGTITDIFPVETISDKFRKRVFWLKQTTLERFPQHFEIELYNESCDLLSKYKQDELVTVSVDVRGRKWRSGKTGKEGVSNSLVAWRIARKSEESSQEQQPAESSSPEYSPVTQAAMDDLPF